MPADGRWYGRLRNQHRQQRSDRRLSGHHPATENSDSSDDTNGNDGDVVTITYSYWGTPDEAASVQAVADKFHEEYPNIKVEVMAIPNEEYVTKLNTMATAGELPDCGIMNESGVLDFASDGLLYDISAMYEGADSMPLDSITFKSEGKPVAYSAANEVLSLYYNKDMFDAAGLDYPSATEAMTWDEFVTLAKTLTLDANGNNALSPDFDKETSSSTAASLTTGPGSLRFGHCPTAAAGSLRTAPPAPSMTRRSSSPSRRSLT